MGFGTETDIRDSSGELVVSHDMPIGGEMSFDSLLRMASECSLTMKKKLPLALNVKADGLGLKLFQAIASYDNLDCFVFDMSVPDMRTYLKLGVPTFTRMSEVERDPVWLGQASGVWLDAFESEWYDNAVVLGLLKQGKRVCIVSPELHGRPHQVHWQQLRALAAEPELMLCTDLPEDAAAYFLEVRG